MSDNEIIEYALERLKNVSKDKRGAQFRTVIAVAKKGLPIKVFSGVLRGSIVSEPHPYREEGLPFQPLFYADEYKQMLYEIHTLPTIQKLEQKIITHRERAVLAALPYLATLTN